MRVSYPKPRIMTHDEHREEELLQWVFNSHCWSEPDTCSMQHCVWCGQVINGYQGVDYTKIPLCMGNPRIRGLR